MEGEVRIRWRKVSRRAMMKESAAAEGMTGSEGKGRKHWDEEPSRPSFFFVFLSDSLRFNIAMLFYHSNS